MRKPLLKIAGYLTLGLGFAGAFVPMMPTTPFLLLSVFCFSKSSPRMKQWLLDNRICGQYLRDYESGNGIPVTVKITALITMWSSILFTAIIFIDQPWIRILLVAISLSVSIHILKIKTLATKERSRKRRILVLFPTPAEMAKFVCPASSDVVVKTIGVGPFHSAYHTLRYIREYDPSLVILAGIAGAYPASELSAGDCLLVQAENSADMGSFTTEGFRAKFSERMECPHLTRVHGFRLVESNSVSAAAAPFVDSSNAAIENMEGAAFFYVCLQNKVPFLELRAVSNTVGEDFQNWNIELATSNLAQALNRLIHEIEA